MPVDLLLTDSKTRIRQGRTWNFVCFFVTVLHLDNSSEFFPDYPKVLLSAFGPIQEDPSGSP